MHIRFHHMQPADASAAALFEVITDYPSYPRFHPAVTDVRVVRKDGAGAEFVAERRTVTGRRLRGYDRYRCHRDLVVERAYEGSPSARSTWTVHAVDHARCTLTVDAVQALPWAIGLMAGPFLRRRLHRTSVMPFVREAERRAREASSR